MKKKIKNGSKSVVAEEKDNSTELREEIIEIISKITKIGTAELKDDIKIQEEAGADSLMIMEIVITLNKKFNINMKEDKLYTIRTIKEFTDYVLQLTYDK